MERQNYFLFMIVFATAADMITSYLDIFVKGLYESNGLLAWLMGNSPWTLLIWLVFWIGLFYSTMGIAKKYKLQTHWEVIAFITSLHFFFDGALNNLILYLTH